MTTLNAPSIGARDDADAHPGQPAAVSSTRVRRADERSFVLLLLLSFPFFLLLAIGARLMTSSQAEPRSVFAVATEAARSTLAIALNL